MLAPYQVGLICAIGQDMTRKLGQFILLLSLLLLLLFISSDVAGYPDYVIFLSGFFFLILALSLFRKSRELRDEKPRFRLIRKLLSRNAEKEE